MRVLAARTPTLHDALTWAAADCWSHVILDGNLFGTDRLGETIDAWCWCLVRRETP